MLNIIFKTHIFHILILYLKLKIEKISINYPNTKVLNFMHFNISQITHPFI